MRLKARPVTAPAAKPPSPHTRGLPAPLRTPALPASRRGAGRPSARILRVPGEIEIEEWKCLAELIDTAFDDFNESMVFII